MADHAVATGGMVDEESPQNGTDHVPHTVSIQNEAHEKNYKQNSKVPGTDCENGTAVQRDGRDKMMVKFLLQKALAGSVIGKGGANIAETQQQSGARIQISKANEFYPGTPYSQDRVILISGTVDELLTALHLVITRTMVQPTNNGASLKSGDDDNRLQLQMLVHSKLCGTLIGKGGMTIRSFNNDSRASIHVSPPPTHPGLHERVVRIAGDVDELMRAVALIVTKLSENPDFFLLSDANLNYGFVYDRHNEAGRVLNTQYLNHNQMDGGGYGSDVTPLWTTPPPPYTSLHPVEVIIPIPDEQVGQVIGKEGSIVKQIKNLVNVDITISKRGDFLPGTCNRACQISGTADAVDLAQRLILQRLNRL